MRRPFFYRKPKTENRKLSFQRFGLVDEHDGDVVLDFINQAAPVADEAVARVIQMDITLAFGAGEDFQKFLADGHWHLRLKKSSIGFKIQLTDDSTRQATKMELQV
jgi:hypothetical protein